MVNEGKRYLREILIFKILKMDGYTEPWSIQNSVLFCSILSFVLWSYEDSEAAVCKCFLK